MRRTPDEIDAVFARGVELARSGSYFDAHEAFEEAWRAASPEERDFFQGLVHVVVAWYQGNRGKRIGCERQLAKAHRRLKRYAPAHRGIDVARVLDQVAAADPRAMNALDLAEAQAVEQPPQSHVQQPLAVEEQQEAERDEQRAAHGAHVRPTVADPSERAHEREPRE